MTANLLSVLLSIATEGCGLPGNGGEAIFSHGRTATQKVLLCVLHERARSAGFFGGVKATLVYNDSFSQKSVRTGLRRAPFFREYPTPILPRFVT